MAASPQQQGLELEAARLKEGALAQQRAAESARRFQQFVDTLYKTEQKAKSLPEVSTPDDKQKALFEAHKIFQDPKGVLRVPAVPDAVETGRSVYLAVAAMAAKGSSMIEVRGGTPLQMHALLSATLANHVAVSPSALARMAEELKAHQSELPKDLDTLIALSKINTELATAHPEMTGEQRRAAILVEATKQGISNAAEVFKQIDEVPGPKAPVPVQPPPLSASVVADPLLPPYPDSKSFPRGPEVVTVIKDKSSSVSPPAPESPAPKGKEKDGDVSELGPVQQGLPKIFK